MSAVGKPDLSFLPRLQSLAHNPTLGLQALAPQEAKVEPISIVTSSRRGASKICCDPRICI